MGTVLNIDLNGEGAYKWLPLAKAKLAAMNARAQASALRCVLKITGADIEILRGNVVDTIKITVGLPYLHGIYVVAPNTSLDAVLSPEDQLARTTHWKSFYVIGSSVPTVELARMPYVGDGYLIELYSNLQDHLADPNNATSWPVLAKADSPGSQCLSSDPARTNHSVSFINDAQFTGYGRYGHRVAVLASGWDSPTTRYRYAISGVVPPGPTGKSVPIFYTGSTGALTLVQAAYPQYPGREHNPFVPSVIGKGVIQALHGITDDPTLAQIAPYFATSTDHGSTWVVATADVLTPYLDSVTASPRNTYNNSQIAALSAYAANIYMGNGRSLLIIPNGLVDHGGSGGTARFAPMAFVGTAGGSYARVSWPPDNWYTGANGFAVDPNNELYYINFGVTDEQGAQLGFGMGCVYLSVRQAGVSSIMYTRDFGASWNFAPVPVSAGGTSQFGATVKPYLSASQPGRIVFATPDFTNNKLAFVWTDGTFQTFKSAGVVLHAKGALTPFPSQGFNYYFVNYGGGRYAPYVFPAFPGEFDKPAGV